MNRARCHTWSHGGVRLLCSWKLSFVVRSNFVMRWRGCSEYGSEIGRIRIVEANLLFRWAPVNFAFNLQKTGFILSLTCLHLCLHLFFVNFLLIAIAWYFHLLRSVLRQIQSMCRHWNQDILGIMRGAQSVLNAMLKHQEMQCNQIWKTSSMRNVVEEACSSLDRRIGQISSGSVQVSTYSHRCIVCWNSNLYESFVWSCFT